MSEPGNKTLAREALKQAVLAGATLADFIALKNEITPPSEFEVALAAKAARFYTDEGVLEFDDQPMVSVDYHAGEPQGGYVMAWQWVEADKSVEEAAPPPKPLVRVTEPKKGDVVFASGDGNRYRIHEGKRFAFEVECIHYVAPEDLKGGFPFTRLRQRMWVTEDMIRQLYLDTAQ